MSWFKAPVLLLSVWLLTACGFTPVYATPDTGSRPGVQQSLSQIEVGLIANRDGQYLRNALLDQMKPDAAGAHRYFLRLRDLRTEDAGFGLRKDGSNTRGDVIITATMELIDTQASDVVLTRNLRTRGGYNRTDNLYGALVGKEDLTDRLLDEMAERVVTELSLFLVKP